MNGTMARFFGAALACTLILGGCVAETGDEEQAQAVGQSVAADTFVPRLAKDPGGKSTAPPTNGGVVPSSPSTTGDPTGATLGQDPEPSPWTPPPH